MEAFPYVTGGLILAAVIAVIVLFKMMWRVAEPNEALVISGLRSHGDVIDEHEASLGFKIVTGKGTLVIPGVQVVRRLSLDLREAELAIACVTHQGIPLGIRGVVIYKVGDDYASISNAARRFLDQQKNMDQRVHNVFAGHLRAIVGNMTVEEMIRDREKLTQLTRESSGVEMEKLGLIVDSLQVQEIEDPTGYISNLGAPHAAAVASQARIAGASADREATEREQEAEALKAEARRAAQVKQSGYQAQIDEAKARAEQAGPLSDAHARQEVVQEETRVAELVAQREEQRLQATVRRPADAQAYEQTTLARAERDARISAAEAQAKEVELAAAAEAQRVRIHAEAEAHRVRMQADAEAEHVKVEADAQAQSTRARGEADAVAVTAVGQAEGAATRAKGLAEAEAIKARADALAHNQEAVIGQTLAERWPEVVRAGAEAFSAIDQLVVLNGAEGLSNTLSQILGQGMAGLQVARKLLSGVDGTETAEAKAAEPKAVEAPKVAVGAGASSNGTK